MSFENNPLRRKLKRAAEVFTLGAVLSATEGCRENPPEVVAPPPVVEKREYQPPLSIDHFRDLSGGVLILAANREEENGVLQTFREQNRRRAESAKFQFEQRVNGRYHVIKTRVKTGENETQQVPIVVMSQDDLQYSEVIDRIAGEKFKFIQLRGHTQDMPGLFNRSVVFQASESLVALGGCKGDGFIKDFYRPERPIIADNNTGYAAVNTHVAIEVIDNIGTATSWQDFSLKLAHDLNAGPQGIILPGMPEYPQYF